MGCVGQLWRGHVNDAAGEHHKDLRSMMGMTDVCLQRSALMHMLACHSKSSSKKSDLGLQKILNSFGVAGQHTMIADARREDPGLVLWWEAEYRNY
jgi:hypothetical protein